jgi:hypothetical protein
VLKISDVLVTVAHVEAVGQVVGHGVGHEIGQLVLWVDVTVVVVTAEGEHAVGSVRHEWDLECEPGCEPE